MLRFIVPAILGLGLLTWMPNSVLAQKGGGRGGGSGGGGGGGHSAPSMGGARPGTSHGSSGPHHGSGHHHHYSHYPRGSIYPFYDPFLYGYSNPSYYQLYPPNYGNAAPYVSPYYLAPSYVEPAVPRNASARIEIFVANADAKVWIDDNPTTSGGKQRTFVSPPLEPGYAYSYRVTAAWKEDGQDVRVERTVQVNPGVTTTVDFSKVDSQQRMPPAKD